MGFILQLRKRFGMTDPDLGRCTMPWKGMHEL